MPEGTKIYKASDWSIWTYVPEPYSFILDFDLLNYEWLGSSGGSLQPVEAGISNIILQEGSTINQGLFSEITPATLTAELIIENFTVLDGDKFLVGSEIALYLENATPEEPYIPIIISPTTYVYRDTKTLFFEGHIDSFNVELEPGSDFATIAISAVSKSSNDLNTLIGVEKDTVTPKNTLIANTRVGQWSAPTFDDYNFGVTEFEEKSLGDFLGDLLLCQAGLTGDTINDDFPLDVNQTGSHIYEVKPVRKQWMFLKDSTMSIEEPDVKVYYEDADISSVTLDWSGAGSPTGVALQNYSDSTETYNFGNANTPGAFVFSGTVDVKDLAQMTVIGKKLLNFNKKFTPVQIVTETVRTFQEVEFKYQPINMTEITYDVPFYFVPNKLAKLLDIVSISNERLGISDQRMFVTGRTIEITPDNWMTTYNLWKGFTN